MAEKLQNIGQQTSPKINPLQEQRVRLLADVAFFSRHFSEKKDMPTSISVLVGISEPRRIVQDETILVEKDRQLVMEKWSFMPFPSAEYVPPVLLGQEDVAGTVESIASGLEMSPEDVFRSVKLTETLSPGNVSVRLPGGLEIIQLGEVVIPPLLQRGIFMPSRKDPYIKLYSRLGEDVEQTPMVFIVGLDLKDTSFPELFPKVLLLYYHVQKEHQLKAALAEELPLE